MRPKQYFAAMTFVVSTVLVGCSSFGPETDLSTYDPAEVDFVLSQVPDGASVPGDILVDTLEFREDCRRLQAFMNMKSRGEADKDVLSRFQEVPQRFMDRGQAEMGSYMRDLVANAELGDVTTVNEFLAGSCQGPVGSPGGVDGVG